MILSRHSIFIAWLTVLTLQGVDQQHGSNGPDYRRMTVDSILRLGKRIDGQRVQLHGRIISGPETSIFMDDSQCRGLQVSGCSIWTDFDHCRIEASNAPKPCSGVIETRSHRRGGREPNTFVLDDVTVRGTISTVRRDITYAKSRSKRLRVGFGHLGAYPAKLDVTEISFEGPGEAQKKPNRPGP